MNCFSETTFNMQLQDSTKNPIKKKSAAAMDRTSLSSFAKIKNISAASGLIFYQDNLYVISDNSSYLTKFNVVTNETNHIKLIDKAAINIPKKIKPDFESLTFDGAKIHIYGSGSTINRQNQVTYDIETGAISSLSLSQDYERLKHLADLKDDEFNIEGVFFDKKYQYYCQRGNKSENKNCIFRLDKVSEDITVFYYELPAIDKIKATFTDAIAVDHMVYFLASAEDSKSTYKDGDIKGTIFGTIDLNTMNLTFNKIISTKNKFEGIALYKKDDKQLQFLICEDKDTNVIESEIFELTYYK